MPKSMTKSIVSWIDFWTNFWWIFEPTWLPKSIQNLLKIDLKINSKIDMILDGFSVAVGSVLEAKLGPKSIKHVPKIDPRGNQFGHRFWHPFVIGFWWKLGATAPCRYVKHIKQFQVFKGFAISAILSWCFVGFILHRFFDDSRPIKPLKLYPTSLKNRSEYQLKKIQFSMFFSGFWEDFGSQVGPKLDQKST